MTDTSRRLAVAHEVVAAQRWFRSFELDGEREQWPSWVLLDVMRQSEGAFAAEDYDRAEHLARVAACVACREAPKFAADPRGWVKPWYGDPPAMAPFRWGAPN